MYETLARLKEVLTFIGSFIPGQRMEPRLILYNSALASLGTDASPNDLAPDEVGCAETIDTIYNKTFAHFIARGKTPTLSTNLLYKALRDSLEFAQVDVSLEGDIVISPTGYGTNRAMPHGHVGIVGKNATIMSNDSRTGTFEQNFTLPGWIRYYHLKGGYPVAFFRRQ